MEPLGLYIHIPFCIRKCKYCDFLSAPANEETMRAYTRALLREIRLRARQMRAEHLQKYPVDTIFFGGGTPTALPADCLSSIIYTVREGFDVLPDAEITCEMNPGTFAADAKAEKKIASPEPDPESLSFTLKDRADPLWSGLRSLSDPSGPGALGEGMAHFLTKEVNRISIGLQSVHDRELETLGRIHTFRDFLACYQALRRFGAKNISVDLMFGLPGQTPDSWEESLRTVAELEPEHISAYGLILEEGTPFFAMEERGAFTGKLALPDEETEREMYRAAKRILYEYGFHRYEISNYAKSGFESRHNCRYWQRRPYLGFGLGAASLFNRRRWRNTRSLENYLSLLEEKPFPLQLQADHKSGCQSEKGCGETGRKTAEVEEKKKTAKHYENDAAEKLHLPVETLEREAEELSERAEMEEFMFLGLRMDRGISEAAFAEAFGRPIGAVYGNTLKKLEGEGFLRAREENDTRWWSLTERGLDLSNRVLAEFL